MKQQQFDFAEAYRRTAESLYHQAITIFGYHSIEARKARDLWQDSVKNSRLAYNILLRSQRNGD